MCRSSIMPNSKDTARGHTRAGTSGAVKQAEVGRRPSIVLHPFVVVTCFALGGGLAGRHHIAPWVEGLMGVRTAVQIWPAKRNTPIGRHRHVIILNTPQTSERVLASFSTTASRSHSQFRTDSSPSTSNSSIKSSLAPGIAPTARRSATCVVSRIFEDPVSSLHSSHRSSSRATHSDKNGALCIIPSSITPENMSRLSS